MARKTKKPVNPINSVFDEPLPGWPTDGPVIVKWSRLMEWKKLHGADIVYRNSRDADGRPIFEAQKNGGQQNG